MDAVSGLFLDALGTDMVTMEEYFPFITKAFDVMKYTAITRAKERVIIVGERRALCIAIKRIDTERRGTKLAARIRSLVAACDIRGLPD